MLDVELDEALAREARIRGVSRSEVVRRILRAELLPSLPPLEEDPLWGMLGIDRVAEPAHHDDVIYPR
jgi:hypothetical protein